MQYIKIEPNYILKHYRYMSKEEIEKHSNNMKHKRYICAFELCKTPMIICAFGPEYKQICYFRAKNNHKIECKWVINARGREEIMIGSQNENESMQRALLSLLNNVNIFDTDNININIGESKRITSYKGKKESTYTGKKISRVKTLPKKYQDLEINTKYKFLKKIWIKIHLTHYGKKIFYINNIFEGQKISLEIKETCGYPFKIIEKHLENILSEIISVELAMVFIFEGIVNYFTVGKEGGKICLWKTNSCILNIVS